MSLHRWFALFVAFALFLPAPARADVPPPNACMTAGQLCSNAPPAPDYKTAGTCTASKCTKQLPGPDGGLQKTEYDCTLCVTGGGSGGTGGSPPAAGGGDSGCSCIVGQARTGGALSVLMLALGAGALFLERRARRS
jgi:hypothetical protein